MKSVMRDRTTSEYPCLKISDLSRAVVLFTGEGEGVLLHPGDGTYEIGESQVWDESKFSVYEGEVVLSN